MESYQENGNDDDDGEQSLLSMSMFSCTSLTIKEDLQVGDGEQTLNCSSSSTSTLTDQPVQVCQRIDDDLVERFRELAQVVGVSLEPKLLR